MLSELATNARCQIASFENNFWAWHFRSELRHRRFRIPANETHFVDTLVPLKANNPTGQVSRMASDQL